MFDSSPSPRIHHSQRTIPHGEHTKLPPDLDLIEILHTMGEMTMHEAHVQVGGPQAAWPVIARLVAAKIAAIWCVESNTERQLADWEVAALFRSRTDGSSEPTPEDGQLRLRAAANADEAYRRDFGAWCDRDSDRGK